MRCGWRKEELGTTSSKGDARLGIGLCDSVIIQRALLAWLGLNGECSRAKATSSAQQSSAVWPGQTKRYSQGSLEPLL